MKDHPYITFLLEILNYKDAKIVNDGKNFVGICPFLYTHAIIYGRAGDEVGYDDRWCYSNYDKAKVAYDAWDGMPGTEPKGWHRHPDSGRRGG